MMLYHNTTEYVCRSMMSACTMAVMALMSVFHALLILHTCQATEIIAGCPTYRYMHNGSCQPCQDNCMTCVSYTNCTKCQPGFYGMVCEKKCVEGCTGTCHKLYGYCTHGCADGTYANTRSLACDNCFANCRVCESFTVCAECHAGFYGENCVKSCSQFCKGGLCDKVDGTCFECEDGSYMLEKECISCSLGCARCMNRDTCGSCKDGFIGPYNGTCLLECANMDSQEERTVCSTGLCQNLSEHWQLSKHEWNLDMMANEETNTCYTEGICVKLNNNETSLELLNNSIMYMFFKCKLVCKTSKGNVSDSCKGHVCYDICELKPLAISSTATWVSSYCQQGPANDSTKGLSMAVILVIVVVLVAFVTCLVLTMRRLRKKNKSSETFHRLQHGGVSNSRNKDVRLSAIRSLNTNSSADERTSQSGLVSPDAAEPMFPNSDDNDAQEIETELYSGERGIPKHALLPVRAGAAPAKIKI